MSKLFNNIKFQLVNSKEGGYLGFDVIFFKSIVSFRVYPRRGKM